MFTFLGKEFRAMFITTVRTRHLIEAPHVQTHALTECDGEGGDFGFLSDSKLLNTALTRAQSLVVVVGDPVALCAVGECVNIWRTYIKHCHNMGSLYPKSHTFDSIKQQVQNLLNSPAREKLLQIANERQTGQKIGTNTPVSSNNTLSSQVNPSGGQLTVESGSSINSGILSNTSSYQSGEANQVKNTFSANRNVSTAPKSPLTPLTPLRTGITRGLAPAPFTSLFPKKPQESFFDIGDEFTLDPDDVLVQLVKLDSGVSNSVTKETISVREENGQAVVVSRNNALLENGVIYPSYDDRQLRTLLSNEGKYVRAQLHVGSGDFKAVVSDGSSKGQELNIPSRWLCGQGNDNDEVVAEVVNEGGEKYGRVVGVLKPSVDLKNRYILCTVGDTSGLMVPIDSGLSPMFNVTTVGNLPENRDGNIIVYQVTKNKQVRKSHMVKVSNLERKDKLIVTRFLKWDNKLQFPLCIVLGMLNVEADLSTCMQVLELEHHLVKTYNPGIAEEVDFLYPDNFRLTNEMLSRTIDLRERWCFTIDPPGVGHSNRAFSIDEVGDGSYQVGVHFTDVASFVKKGSSVDIEARSRGVACFPTQGETIHMLPKRLSTQLCSLKSDEDRLAFSVIMTVKPTGDVVQVNIQKTIINCKKNFSMKDAQDILQDPTAHEDYLKSCVLVLFEIARLWRKDRLGNAYLYHESALEKSTVFAHQLVQDMVIMTEFHIAQKVVSKFPETTPLLVQEPPDAQALQRWRHEHAADAVNSIALTKPFLNASKLEVCKCGLACTHTVNFVRQSNVVKREQIEVISVLWDSLSDAVGYEDFCSIQDIIVYPENHPQLAVALSQLQSIQQPEKFVCSSDVTADGDYHYSVNRQPYTSVTQPLNCYIDIVVQRLLNACLESTPSPYSQPEVQIICSEITNSHLNKKQFEKETLRVQFSSALLTRPSSLYSVIVNLNLENIEMCFPSLLSVAPSRRLDLINLGVSEQPVYNESGAVILKWQERVYDYGVLQNKAVIGSNYGELNPDRFIYKIPAFQWQRLLIAIREQDEGVRVQKLNSAVETVRKQVSNPALEGSYIEEVTSEVQKLGNIKHLTEFSLQLSSSQLLWVQLSATVQPRKALLAPYIQLLNLTNQLDICLQHSQQPDTCFTNKDSIVEPSVSGCKDIRTYQKAWKPILELEAASNAVKNNDRIFVNNVPIEWKQDGGKRSASGYLTLPLSFMKQRQIKISSNFEQDMLFRPDNSLYRNAYFSDFVCIRYSNLALPNNSGFSEEVAQLVNTGGIFTWVGHCSVSDVSLGNNVVILKLHLIKSDVPLPVHLLRGRQCTVEWITRTEADRLVLFIFSAALLRKK